MKSKTVLFTLLAVMSVGNSASAAEDDAAPVDKNETKRGPRFKRGAKWTLLGHGLGIPAYLLWMTTAHEGGHALAAEISGIKVTAFKPYPHFEDFSLGRRFVWGNMATERVGTPKQEALILAAPQITDIVFFTAADLTLTYGLDSDSAAAPFVMMGGMICPLVDFLVNVNGPSAANDSTRWGQLVGMPKWSIMLIGDALAAVAVWRILHHGRAILFDKDSATESPAPAITVTPTFSPDFAGLALAGRF
jgi:hypothetical protein